MPVESNNNNCNSVVGRSGEDDKAGEKTVPSPRRFSVERILAPFLKSSASQNSLMSRKRILSETDPASFRPPNTGWSSQIEFLFTCISYAVGLGNVWRFPYMCYKNGGGAFLFPYLIMLVVVGMPVFFLEIAFGQFASLGPLTIWTINPFFKGLGYGMVIVSIVIGLYYNVIIAQCTLYFFMSMRSELAWDSCGNDWNTPECFDTVIHHDDASTTITNQTSQQRTTPLTSYTYDGVHSLVGTKTEEFYLNFVLNQSPNGIDDIGIPHWPITLCLLFCWVIVALGLIKGISSLGKISYFTALFPYIMLTILLIRSATLPGAGDGIMYYITPDFNRLQDLMVWQEAAIQIFYNLSCAVGGLIVMSSFNKFNNNLVRDALIVPILNAFTSVFAGLVVFSVLGFMAHSKNTTVDKVASDGPGLIFIVYPEALAKLPVGPLWSILFFLMMMTLGFGSELSFVETILTSFIDDFHGFFNTKFRNISYRLSVCAVGFLLGLPMVCRGGIYVLQLLDCFVCFLALLLISLLELVVLTWIYGFPKFTFCDDVSMMLNRQVPLYFRYMLRYVTPIALLILLIVSVSLFTPPSMNIGGVRISYPSWALSFGWFIAFLPVIPIPGWMIYYHCCLGGLDSLRDYVRPMVNWGPREQEFRQGRYANQTQAIAALQAIRTSQSQEQLTTVSVLPEKVPEKCSENGENNNTSISEVNIVAYI